jgi:hypothetical protein
MWEDNQKLLALQDFVFYQTADQAVESPFVKR